MENEFEPMYGGDVSIFLKRVFRIPIETHAQTGNRRAYYFEQVMGAGGTLASDSRSFVRLENARCYFERDPGPDNYRVSDVLYINKDNIESIVFHEEK